MEEYLVNYEALSKIIDDLITQKYPHQPTEDFADLRKESIKELDNQITTNVFRRLSESELDTLNHLLDQKSSTETDFRNFFKSVDLDLPQIITETIRSYSEAFLKGEHDA